MISEGMLSPSGVAAHQDARAVFRSGAHMGRKRFYGLVDHGDVMISGVRPGVSGAQGPSQCFTTCDLWTVQECQQGVEAERALPGRGSVLFLSKWGR